MTLKRQLNGEKGDEELIHSFWGTLYQALNITDPPKDKMALHLIFHHFSQFYCCFVA